MFLPKKKHISMYTGVSQEFIPKSYVMVLEKLIKLKLCLF